MEQTINQAKHNVKWKVSLSTGETFYEDKGMFEEAKGELSPWIRLLEYARNKGASLTSLSLYTDDGRTFNLPSAGKCPNFKKFQALNSPMSYTVYRQVGQELLSNNYEEYTVAKVNYSTGSLELWVDERNSKHCWSLWIPLQTLQEH